MLSVVYMLGRNASVNRWSGEVKKRAEIHQGRYPRRGAAAVEMGASCCFSLSRPQPQTQATPPVGASRDELPVERQSNHPARLFFRLHLAGDHRLQDTHPTRLNLGLVGPEWQQPHCTISHIKRTCVNYQGKLGFELKVFDILARRVRVVLSDTLLPALPE